jgi:hypothetical protein
VTLFILGAPRSGTTLLYKSLCLHPDAAWLSNWSRKAPGVPAATVLNRVARAAPRRRTAVWFDAGANAYVYGRSRGVFERTFPTPVEGEPVYARCGFDETAADGGVVDEAALRSMVADVRRYSGGSVFVGKRIANNRRVPQLFQSIPDSRFVLLIRDGRAVALSLSEVDWWPDSRIWWCGMTPVEWAALGRDPWTLCGRAWVEENTAALAGLAAVPPDRTLVVRYEDMLRDPTTMLRDVAAFAGLPPSRQWEDSLRPLSFPNRNDRWPEALSADVVRHLTELQRDRLAQFGYLPATRDVSSAEPRPRVVSPPLQMS